MDLATILGIILGLAMILVTIAVEGGGMLSLHWPSITIVLSGTLAPILIAFPLSDLIQASGMIKQVFAQRKVNSNEVVRAILTTANL